MKKAHDVRTMQKQYHREVLGKVDQGTLDIVPVYEATTTPRKR